MLLKARVREDAAAIQKKGSTMIAKTSQRMRNMRHFAGLGVLTCALLGTPALAEPLAEAVEQDMPSLLTLYRDLHANPELSMQEKQTPTKLAGEMRKLGFTVTTGVGKTGVVAVLRNGPGP